MPAKQAKQCHRHDQIQGCHRAGIVPPHCGGFCGDRAIRMKELIVRKNPGPGFGAVTSLTQPSTNVLWACRNGPGVSFIQIAAEAIRQNKLFEPIN